MVGMELRQQLKLAQQLVMTPQLQQAIKLLQLSRIELVDMVQQELEENPVLEESAEPAEKPPADGNGEAVETKPEVSSEPTEQEAVTGANEVDWEKYLENYANQAPTPTSYQAPADGLPTLEATLGSKESLADHLRWQLRMTTVNDEEEHFINLYKTDAKLFENLAKGLKPVVDLSEIGKTGEGKQPKSEVLTDEKKASEIERLDKVAKAL